MDYFHDFEERAEQRRRDRFEEFQRTFNEAMRERKAGGAKTFDELFGAPPPVAAAAAGARPWRAGDGCFPPPQDPPPADARKEQLQERLAYLLAETTDEDPGDVLLRALAVYQSMVKEVRDGGAVKYVKADGTERTLKVRLR